MFKENITFVSDQNLKVKLEKNVHLLVFDSIATVGEIRVYRRADFQSGSRVLKKVF